MTAAATAASAVAKAAPAAGTAKATSTTEAAAGSSTEATAIAETTAGSLIRPTAKGPRAAKPLTTAERGAHARAAKRSAPADIPIKRTIAAERTVRTTVSSGKGPAAGCSDPAAAAIEIGRSDAAGGIASFRVTRPGCEPCRIPVHDRPGAVDMLRVEPTEPVGAPVMSIIHDPHPVQVCRFDSERTTMPVEPVVGYVPEVTRVVETIMHRKVKVAQNEEAREKEAAVPEGIGNPIIEIAVIRRGSVVRDGGRSFIVVVVVDGRLFLVLIRAGRRVFSV